MEIIYFFGCAAAVLRILGVISASGTAVQTVRIGRGLSVTKITAVATAPDPTCHARFFNRFADHDAILLELFGQDRVEERVTTAVQREDKYSKYLKGEPKRTTQNGFFGLLLRKTI